MRTFKLSGRLARLDLQAKVVLVLCICITPIFLLVAFATSQLTLPVVEEEIRAMGQHAARNLSEEIQVKRLLGQGREKELEQRILSTFYLQPNVVQVDVYRANANATGFELAATTDDPASAGPPPGGSLPDQPLSARTNFEDGTGYWEVWAPIRPKKGPPLGAVRMEVSLQAAASLGNAVWKIMAVAGLATITCLILVLSYFLRRTIQNDRKLRLTENENVNLSAQLRDAERQLVMKEKLAVMGQLTASFAHEIGTPLNAMGGHLDLLRGDLEKEGAKESRMRRLDILRDQLQKIENIVKGFLQSTAKPVTQFQLLDLNKVMDKTLQIVSPRLDAMGVRLDKSLDNRLGPVRAVPLDVEQVLLNLLNNSLDSLQSKRRLTPSHASRLEVFSRYRREGLAEWVELGVLDTGTGIPRKDLERVFDPFYTTKAVGEGTGLGLTICREILEKYQGRLEIDSKEGAWTKVTLRMPYGANA
ncbi:MAG: HAMP domain-containing histidine kinase [Proteobacteria bacterium]|nr:MAG: HAMP domain-containing histidine kinase [Pseudomonadota bacterium]